MECQIRCQIDCQNVHEMSIYIYISSIIADIMSVGGDHSKKVILQVKSGSSPPNSEITEHFMCLYRLTHPHVGGDQRPEEDPPGFNFAGTDPSRCLNSWFFNRLPAAQQSPDFEVVAVHLGIWPWTSEEILFNGLPSCLNEGAGKQEVDDGWFGCAVSKHVS